MKRSMRSRLRWNEEQWGRNVDQCALAIYVIEEAKKDKRVTEDMINNMQRAFVNGFLPDHSFCLCFLCLLFRLKIFLHNSFLV